MTQPTILSIDTSCDETSVAISQGRRIISNIISSQVNIHASWGGVVPLLAKRAHLEKIEPVTKEAMERASTRFKTSVIATSTNVGDSSKPLVANLDAIAVTIGPGLAPALEVGIAYAKKLSLKYQKPLIPINHMEGHLLSPLALKNSKGHPPLKKTAGYEPACELWNEKLFPAIGLLVSGGHTQLILVKKIGQYQLLGQTLDDAAGEALDKLAKMLKLGYPGGPIIEILAKLGNPQAIKLPIPMQHSKDLNFSFSGLKTAALYQIQKAKLTKQYTYNMSAAFQQAIATSLTTKLKKAISLYSPKSILLGGGVFSNIYIRNQVRKAVKQLSLPLYLPYSKKLFTDNAAMICIPAYYKYLKKDFVNLPFGKHNSLDRQPNLSL